jgi:hypothetical protein
MKIDKSVATFNGILFGLAVLLLITSRFDASIFGLLAILIGAINFFMFLIYAVTRKKNAMLNSLIVAGILFTIGFSVCSNTSFNMH